MFSCVSIKPFVGLTNNDEDNAKLRKSEVRKELVKEYVGYQVVCFTSMMPEMNKRVKTWR